MESKPLKPKLSHAVLYNSNEWLRLFLGKFKLKDQTTTPWGILKLGIKLLI